ncbi:hypothetical protein K502DRAFT_262428 [Neoconidiobolus thromboides FSU 785]|nr:hypothetical protein K502DRAFT_262428 [Neoconidiobolus thromboides FSU 785]
MNTNNFPEPNIRAPGIDMNSFIQPNSEDSGMNINNYRLIQTRYDVSIDGLRKKKIGFKDNQTGQVYNYKVTEKKAKYRGDSRKTVIKLKRNKKFSKTGNWMIDCKKKHEGRYKDITLFKDSVNSVPRYTMGFRRSDNQIMNLYWTTESIMNNNWCLFDVNFNKLMEYNIQTFKHNSLSQFCFIDEVDKQLFLLVLAFVIVNYGSDNMGDSSSDDSDSS